MTYGRPDWKAALYDACLLPRKPARTRPAELATLLPGSRATRRIDLDARSLRTSVQIADNLGFGSGCSTQRNSRPIARTSDNNVEMFDRFLTTSDSIRVVAVLHRLAQHHVQGWALTGGLATEIRSLLLGAEPQRRSLNDLDFVAAHFADIPETLAGHFLFRHIHPDEIPGRTMAQFVDVAAKLRVDVFRAIGASMARASQVALPTGTIKILAVEDLIARLARVSLDLADGIPTPQKYALDFLRLSKLKTPSEVQSAWHDHRKPGHPISFVEASRLLHELISTQENLLIVPDYSKDVSEECRRCVPMLTFPLADRAAIVSILGYC